MRPNEDALLVGGLNVAYGRRRIVQDLTLPPIRRGQVTALIGPNGTGKSTVLKALARVVPSDGDLHFGSADLRQLSPRQRAAMIGYMPQVLPQGTELTALESVIIALKAGGEAGNLERRAVGVVERLGIAELALAPLDRLSGGERQLVSLAQAIARDPAMLFLDEPTSALDLGHVHQVMRLVQASARNGAAVVIVLHDLALAAQWADRTIVLKSARLHSAGAPRDVITPSMLADVYGFAASVEHLGKNLFIVPDRGAPADAPRSLS
ncbi:ABC transporter ATP-binding protein [Nitratireductor thuwali]|uniref:Fe(3+) dicitrate transport ATP-binding protein FecE n=1 Tax=Nitratireductor thuwali TaxID=2267699 RepID=A0ABY5MKC6_9HYPH|nr:Fe(3+) dicitrate transport ATP-binding protein FecE [Nitratireductor thuwali]